MGTVRKRARSPASLPGVTEESEPHKTRRHLFRLMNALSAPDSAPDNSGDLFQPVAGSRMAVWEAGSDGR